MAEKKKKRRRSSFAAALAQAKSRLAKARLERSAAAQKIYDLDIEIPHLSKIVQALGGTGEVMPSEHTTQSVVTGEHRAETSVDELEEDDLLPEIEGKPLIEE